MNKWETIKKTARELRRNQTSEEKILWNKLRNRQLDGKKFLRQHPILVQDSAKPEFYVVDFYCAEYKLIIEIDGKVHDFQKEYDKDRAQVLKSLGYQIIRFNNEELNDIEKVLNNIREYLV